MFNFVEKKSFFYFSTIASLLLSFCVFFVFTANFKTFVINILVILMLLAMMILYNYQHKEIMKVLLTSFFTILILSRMDRMVQMIYIFKDGLVGTDFVHDPIRRTIVVVCVSITSIILPILFINHFILNYNGKYSKIVININKFLLVVMALATIMEVISSFVAESKAGLFGHLSTYYTVGSIGGLLFRCMTIVSVEAFINSRRAEKNAASTKSVSTSSSVKKKTNKKSNKKSKKK